MKIKTAINRIYWRFGGNDNKKPFPVNENDVEAYNAIKNYIAEKEQQQFLEQELFAKLFIYLYQKVLENDQGNIFENHCRRKIYNLLKKPMPTIIEDFKNSLNESEMYQAMEDANVENIHPALKNDKQQDNELEALTKAAEDPETIKKLTGDVWDLETVENALTSEVNQAIDLFQRSTVKNK